MLFLNILKNLVIKFIMAKTITLQFVIINMLIVGTVSANLTITL